MNKIRLRIEDKLERKGVVNALINNGYRVWSEVEEANQTEFEDVVYVCFEVSNKEAREEVINYLVKIIKIKKSLRRYQEKEKKRKKRLLSVEPPII